MIVRAHRRDLAVRAGDRDGEGREHHHVAARVRRQENDRELEVRRRSRLVAVVGLGPDLRAGAAVLIGDHEARLLEHLLRLDRAR